MNAGRRENGHTNSSICSGNQIIHLSGNCMHITANIEYKGICQRKRIEYVRDISIRLDRIKDSKEWWSLARELKGKKMIVGSGIAIGDFVEYFKDKFNPGTDSNSILYAEPDVCVPELDCIISESEISKIINKMKNNKAPGPDRITSEFFKKAPPNFIAKLAEMFNNIYDSGEVPDCFNKAIIFPLFKKGEVNDVNNYRGITFMNVVAKIFVGVLYERLAKWEQENKILNEYQAGFRANYGTVDNIFNLYSIIKLCWNRGIRKVYCFFVDFRGAFDAINRKALLFKLHNYGISSKMVNIFRNLYTDTKVAVWNGENVSEYFDTTVGVKQGCPASPILFSFFLNDLHEHLEEGLDIDNINVRALLYADDIVIMADKPSKLQNMINRLETYCNTWNMAVNLDKSKIIIFCRGGGRRRGDEKWIYQGEEIEIVKSYKYLGITLTPKLSLKKHLTERLNVAKGGINGTWATVLRKKDVSPTAKFKIFQAVSRSIMCYGAQMWGFEHHEEVEKLQRFFVKKLIGLPNHTPNYMIGLETGLQDIYIHTLRLHLKYLSRIFKLPDNRLPNILARKTVSDEIFWYEELNVLAHRHNLSININEEGLGLAQINDIISKEDKFHRSRKIERARQGVRHGMYEKLNYDLGDNYYFRNDYSIPMIRAIFRCRGSLLPLYAYSWSGNTTSICTLCNRSEEEDIMHFLATCPILAEFRRRSFGKSVLTREETLNILNGCDWFALYEFESRALKYRQLIIEEFT